MRSPIHAGRVLAALVLPAALAGCLDAPMAPCDPSLVPVSGAALFVSATCGSDEADGSLWRPFATVAAAAVRATAGTTIVIGGGTFAESVTLAAGVHLRGAGRDATRLQPRVGTGIFVSPAASGVTTRIRNLGVTAATGVGIAATGAALDLEDVAVEATHGAPGHGVQVREAARFSAHGCRFAGNAGAGVSADRVGQVRITDPAPTAAPICSVIGLVDPLFAPRSEISGNGGGGLDVSEASGAVHGPALVVEGSDIRDNRRFGVRLVGAGATFARSALRGTVAVPGTAAADGLVVAPGVVNVAPPLVILASAVAVHGNGRVGILVTGTATVVVGADVAFNPGGGLWARGPVTVVQVAKSARFFKNGLVGIAVTEGATLQVASARIEATRPGPVAAGGSAADGIGVFTNAHAYLQDTRLDGNARAAVVVRGGAVTAAGVLDVEFAAVRISGGQVGLGLSGAMPAAAVATLLDGIDLTGTQAATADATDWPLETAFPSPP